MTAFKPNTANDWSKVNVDTLREYVRVYSLDGFNCSPEMKARFKATARAARRELNRRK